MREIELTQGQVALVDEGIYELLSQRKWLAHKSRGIFYARRGEASNGRSRNKQITVFMHNIIWEQINGRPVPEGLEVDHIDRNGLNNQYSNFRLATRAQQTQNRGMCKNNTSGYMGVSWAKDRQKNYAYISVDNKRKNLGYFDDPIEAAHVRDQAEIKYHGEFAVLNFPDEVRA